MKISNIRTLINSFNSEQACIDYLEKLRWNSKPKCVFCNGGKPYKLKKGWKCSDKKCRKKFNVKTGTIFHNSKISLKDWFLAFYLVLFQKNKGISSTTLALELGITQKSAWYLLQKIRIVLGNSDKIDLGLNNPVEIDELHLGGIDYYKHLMKTKRTHTFYAVDGSLYLKKEIVLGMIERGGKLVLKHVRDKSSKTIKSFVNNHLVKGSTIYSDEFSSYNWLKKSSYSYHSVNHSCKMYVDGEVYTNTIENVWSHLQTGIKSIYNRPKKKYFQRYLDEFSSKFNTRHLPIGESMKLFLTQIECYKTHKDILL